MSRRYPVADRYEEIERDYYRNGPRSTRDYEELDVELNRGGREVDFLREDYGRTTSGPLVVRERERPSRARSVDREEVIVRRSDRDRYRRDVERDEVDVTIRKDEGRPRRRREVDREEIRIERDELRRPSRAVERDDVVIRRSESHRRPARREVDYEVDIRREDRERGRVVNDREEVVVRRRSQSRPRVVERDREDIVMRRRSSSGSPRRRTAEEEIIIRRKEERSPTPPPVLELEPIIRPPIHQQIRQEIITHHHHVDHGVERARPRSPLPPPSRKVDETIEVDIRRRGRNGEAVREEVDVDVDIERRRGREEVDVSTRSRSISVGRSALSRRYQDDDFAEEAEYYNRKAMERAYVGEGYDGATREWAIVDVPPGTRRVRMDGAGGGSQEITWQRYNGVRRSKFIVGDREYDSGFGVPEPRPEVPLPPVSRPSDMWTEITKDLVIKEAIDIMGYPYEETEFFYYIMDYLRYEDVLQLVQLSDDIRRDHRRRIRELEWERQELEAAAAARDRRRYDNRLYEREIVIDRRR